MSTMTGKQRGQMTTTGRRGPRMLMLVLAGALALAGCGGEGDEGYGALGGGGELSVQQQRMDYADAMDRMRTALDDPDSPPIQQSITSGNRKQLMAAAQRWDQATATAASIKPPKEIEADHKALVASMRQLGEWNRRIANAAPRKGQTRRLGKKAQKSKAAQRFSQAVNRIESKGYAVMSEPDGGDPFAGAGDPAG